DNDGLDPGGGGFLDRHVGQAEIGVAARQTELAEGDFRPPKGNARGGFCGELVGGVADEQQIRSAQGHRPYLSAGGFAKPMILRNCRSPRKPLAPAALAAAAPRAAIRAWNGCHSAHRRKGWLPRRQRIPSSKR